MKTIRHNTYETNSSSSHSITIVRNTEPSLIGLANPALIDGNMVLYPARLRDHVSVSGLRYGSMHQLQAAVTDTKAALLVHQLTNFFGDNFHEDWCASILPRAYDVIKDECGYTDICTDDFYPNYDLGNRYGDDSEYPEDFPPLDFLGRTLSDKPIIDLDGLRSYIREYVANPYITIIDTSESH